MSSANNERTTKPTKANASGPGKTFRTEKSDQDERERVEGGTGQGERHSLNQEEAQDTEEGMEKAIQRRAKRILRNQRNRAHTKEKKRQYRRRQGQGE